MLVMVGDAVRENDEQEMMIYLAWIILGSTLTGHACRTSSNFLCTPLYEWLTPIPAHQHEIPSMSNDQECSVLYTAFKILDFFILSRDWTWNCGKAFGIGPKGRFATRVLIFFCWLLCCKEKTYLHIKNQ